MNADLLERLRALYDSRESIPAGEGSRWVSEVSEILHALAPDHAAAFDEVTPFLFAGLSDIGVRPYWEKALSVVRGAIAEVSRQSGVGGRRDGRVQGGVMQVLVSWSGPASHAFALALRNWLPTVLPFVEPWVSSEDIAKGKRWGRELGQKLEECGYCVTCITPGTEFEPWVNFEAGAISKALDESHVSPLLLGVDQAELDGLPLSQFQCTEFTHGEVKKLLFSMNAAAGSPLAESEISRNLDNTWRALVDQVDDIPLDHDDEEHEDEDDQGAVLHEVEEDILALLAAHVDQTLDLDDIASQTDEKPLRVQYHLDRLLDSGHVFDVLNTRYPTEYGVTAQGRAYVIEHELDE